MSAWVKVLDSWFEGPAEEAPAEVAMVHLSALAHSARNLTDGFIKRTARRRLWPAEDIDAVIVRLVELGWWVEVDGGWQIKDWRMFILPASEVEKLREDNRVRQERHRRHKAGDHSLCDRCNALRNSVTNGVNNAPPNRTDPNRPGGEERGGAAAGSAGAPPTRLPVGELKAWKREHPNAKFSDPHPYFAARSDDGQCRHCGEPPAHRRHEASEPQAEGDPR